MRTFFLSFRVLAPITRKRAALEKDGGSDTGPILAAITLDIENHGLLFQGTSMTKILTLKLRKVKGLLYVSGYGPDFKQMAYIPGQLDKVFQQ